MGLWEFLIIGSAISTCGWVANNWIRARHGYPLRDKGGTPDTKDMDEVCAENARLMNQIGRLESRLAVLERIATDPAERTAQAIDRLR